MKRSLHIVTGEYPPQSGGVADHTAYLAESLMASGLDVHVWCPADQHGDDTRDINGVTVHRVDELFHARGRRTLEAFLTNCGSAWTLLLQYTPNTLGMRGLNLPYCAWLLRLSRKRADGAARADIRVMFHEPFYYFSWRGSYRNLLALAQRAMAWLLLRAASVVYVSTPSWEALLRPFAPRSHTPMHWLPIFSTIAVQDDPAAVVACRSALGDACEQVVLGHFGSYGEHTANLIAPVLSAVLESRPNTHLLLLGRGSDRFAAELTVARPALSGRITARGFLSPTSLSVCLQACDVALQPYPDGATSRRSSLMAVLSHGVAVVTTDGLYTEPLWRAEGAPLLVPVAESARLHARVLELVDNAHERALTAAAGRSLAERWFGAQRTIDSLLLQPEPA